jgi:hypothetical protein
MLIVSWMLLSVHFRASRKHHAIPLTRYGALFDRPRHAVQPCQFFPELCVDTEAVQRGLQRVCFFWPTLVREADFSSP